MARERVTRRHPDGSEVLGKRDVTQFSGAIVDLGPVRETRLYRVTLQSAR